MGLPVAQQEPMPRQSFVIRDEITPLRSEQLAFFRWKYRIDRALACVLLAALSPVILLLYLLVKVSSPGPGLYRQERLGEGGTTFVMLKLRSMRHNAEAKSGPKWADKNDNRVTWIGRWLRKLHLDELTQLWNVVRGEMSLVGPRPERPEISEVLHPVIDRYYDRLKVRPGVTGLAQINLPPDHTLEDAMRKQVLDLNYIDHAGPWLDLRMLVATALRLIGLRGETVMRMMFLCRRDLVRHIKDSGVTSDSPLPFQRVDKDAWRFERVAEDPMVPTRRTPVEVAAGPPPRNPR